MGYLREQTGSFEGGLQALAAIGALSTLWLFAVRERKPKVLGVVAETRARARPG